MQFIIINGPNLNLLGRRETDIYGTQTFEDYLAELRAQYTDHCIDYYQSNYEGALIDKLQEVGYSIDGIIMNPAAYTHTSIAIADAVKAIESPVVEVHISDIYQRESYRHVSYVKEGAVKSIIGQGLAGYAQAIDHLIERLSEG